MKKMPFLQEQETHRQSPALVRDGLYCEEEGFGEDYSCGFDDEICDKNMKKEQTLSSVLLQEDLFWEENELLSLISKEKETHVRFDSGGSKDGSVMVARREAVEWFLRVKAHYGFSALTGVLAVNYFDRFISSSRFQSEKPWMGQLAAVACLSLAAKVEETHVPLLLDLQVEDAKYIFEAKTIKRMELLVLSTLQWRMNPVTSISFFDHIIRRLGLKTHLHWEFLWRCERLLLSVISDSRFMNYLPSILATVTMLHVVKEVDPCNQLESQNQLMAVLKTNEDEVNECYKLIIELSGSQNQCHKRKYLSKPSSPNGVIDASLNSESSNDSWAVTSSHSLASVSQFKRSRAQVQQMRLPSLNCMCVDMLSSPH
ncbi:CYCLIN-D3-2 [Salix purpurea]|uniref:B-like cyclin n=1 Tax=Salix purpurea TaxID=77065 RepID=A0A9Q0ZN20_SALPP|nr:CYCLIN-D3-2 [Salix purpurea]